MRESHKRQLDREAALAEKLICKACDGAGRKIIGQQANGLPIGKRCVPCRGSGLALHYVPADKDGAADLLNLIDELAAEVKNGQAMGLGDISIANRIRATYTQEIVSVGLAGIPDAPLSEEQISRVEMARKAAHWQRHAEQLQVEAGLSGRPTWAAVRASIESMRPPPMNAISREGWDLAIVAALNLTAGTLEPLVAICEKRFPMVTAPHKISKGIVQQPCELPDGHAGECGLDRSRPDADRLNTPSPQGGPK